MKALSDDEIKAVAKVVSEYIYKPSRRSKINIFLCGADIGDKGKARYKMAKLLESKGRFELLYPEEVFDDLLMGQGHSLLTLESILANSVDAILIFPESPGSLAEVGAFANDKLLLEKLICISEKKHQKKKSFINFGPLRLIKSSKTGKLIYIDYSDFDDEAKRDKVYEMFVHALNKMRKFNPIKPHIGNILETENFVLPCIYLIDELTNVNLYNVMEHITSLDSKYCEIATKSALGRLISKRFILRKQVGYSVTALGAAHVRETFGHGAIDAAKIEMLNFRLRNKSALKCARMVPRAFSKRV